jgi:hypothetical protein
MGRENYEWYACIIKSEKKIKTPLGSLANAGLHFYPFLDYPTLELTLQKTLNMLSLTQVY